MWDVLTLDLFPNLIIKKETILVLKESIEHRIYGKIKKIPCFPCSNKILTKISIKGTCVRAKLKKRSNNDPKKTRNRENYRERLQKI
jgi:hypothetical protein